MKRNLYKGMKLGAVVTAAVLLTLAPMTVLADNTDDSKGETKIDIEDTDMAEISIATPTEAKRADTESDAEADEELTAEIIGRWDADDAIGLKFGEKGKGKLILSKKDYSFTYKIKNDQLSLNFTNSKVMDCTYTVSVTADKLTIIGGEGTTGETFELTRH